MVPAVLPRERTRKRISPPLRGLLSQVGAFWAAGLQVLQRAMLLSALVLAISRHRAVPPASLTRCSTFQPPMVAIATHYVVTGDLSTAVRVHRNGRFIDVWLITPHSKHWQPNAMAPPLFEQLDAVGWQHTTHGHGRIQRLAPAVASARPPQPRFGPQGYSAPMRLR